LKVLGLDLLQNLFTLWVGQVGMRERDRETETEIFAAGMRFVAGKWSRN
jgi:hypothetical protein